MTLASFYKTVLIEIRELGYESPEIKRQILNQKLKTGTNLLICSRDTKVNLIRYYFLNS